MPCILIYTFLSRSLITRAEGLLFSFSRHNFRLLTVYNVVPRISEVVTKISTRMEGRVASASKTSTLHECLFNVSKLFSCWQSTVDSIVCWAFMRRISDVCLLDALVWLDALSAQIVSYICCVLFRNLDSSMDKI